MQRRNATCQPRHLAKRLVHLAQYKKHLTRGMSLLILLTLFTHSVVHAVRAQESIGYVFDVKGEWAIRGHSQNLSRADSLPSGGIIEFRKATFGKNYIYVADRAGRIILSGECFNYNVDDCREPIRLPKDVPGNYSLLSRVFSAVMSLWRSDPKKYDAHISRAPGHLEEAVIKLTSQTVDLSLPFRNKGSDKYLLRFVPRGKAGLKPVESVHFDWDSEKRSPLIIPGIKPGLYEVQLLNVQDKKRMEPGEEVWVLLAFPGKYYEESSAQFERMLTETAQWSAKGLEEPRRSFLRAYLSYLDARKRK